MGTWIDSGFKQRQENVVQQILETADYVVRLVDVTTNRNETKPQSSKFLQKSGDLNEPTDVVRIHPLRNCPVRQLIPFISAAAVNRKPKLGILVLAFFQVRHNLQVYRFK